MSNENVADPSPPEKPADVSPAAPPVQNYIFGPFRIDVEARHLIRDDAVIPLTAKVFDTLLVLVKNHHRAVSKDELMQAVWPGSFVSDDSLVQNISAIRRALGDDPSQPRYIATLARRGYRFIAPTEEHNGKDVPPQHHTVNDTVHEERPAAVMHAPVAVPTRSPVLWRVAAAFVAGLAVAALAYQAWAPAGASTASGGSIRFQEDLPPGHALRGAGVPSPDSRYLAFVGRDTLGGSQLWIRELGGGGARPIEGTEGASRPFWAPDSQSIAFFAGGQVKRVGVSDGSPRVLAATQRYSPLGGTWSSDDLILYADQGKIFSVNASGGTPVVVLEPDRDAEQGELRWPQFLPDGQRFLFFAASENPERAGTYVGWLGSRETMRLVGGTSQAIYAPPGYLLYVRERVVMAQRFDLERGQLQGDPMTVAGDVSEKATLSATSGGLLTISEETAGGRLVWYDRTGKELGTVNMPKVFSNMALSPNNRQLLGASSEGGNWVMWLVDLDRNVSTQIGVNGSFPAWAPDGARFAFSSMRGGEADVFVRSVMGTAREEALLKSDEVKSVSDWSPDGRFIVFNDHKRRDLWMVPTFGDRKPMPLVQAQGGLARGGKVSPDGRAIAYTSDETGTTEVYVQSFPEPGAKRRVSASGGSQPVWRQDGRELFYSSRDQTVMAVPMQPGGEGLEPGRPQALFSTSYPPGALAVTRDGQRFLIVAGDPVNDTGSITVLTNWEAAQRP